mgnify:CR=1 FL=1
MGNETGKIIQLPYSLSVRDLAGKLNSSPVQVIKVLMANGVMASINQQVDFDTAAIVAAELCFEAAQETFEEEEIAEVGEIPMWRRLIMDENPKDLVNRPPVVTILGHVDHGKTTLLDAIRQANVAEGEAGGITQHIGAYQVEHKGNLITFLDTPGHAAFTAMRARGAQGADIVILVVAADDGVMPQTKEAISHAKAARVPIIVALNKIDRPDANPEFAKRQLSENGLVPDDWDGDTMVVPVSAKLRKGIDDLLEAILLTTEGMSIKANPTGKKIGTVIESEIDRSKGVMATLLIQNGTVNSGDIVVAGTSYGRIRAMFDFKNKNIRKAGPSTPILIMGMNDVPQAGDIFQVVGSTKEAISIVNERKQSEKDSRLSSPKATLEELFNRVQSGEEKELRLLIKADVQGSLEPIISSLNELSNDEISIVILHAEAGNISENDVMLASASKGIIVGFNVSADSAAKRMAEAEGVSIRLYEIIYRLIEDVEKALKGMLEPEFVEIVLGKAEVLATFRIQKVGVIAGSKVVSGEIRRNANARVIRNDEVIHEGEIGSLKHEKDDVREIRTGFECGIGLKGFSEFEVGDTIVCFTRELSTKI